MMRHKKKKEVQSKFKEPTQAMKLEGDMRFELTKFVRRGSMKLDKPPLLGIGARFRTNEKKELAFGASSSNDMDDTIPPPLGLEKESSMADLISDTAVQGREQRR